MRFTGVLFFLSLSLNASAGTTTAELLSRVPLRFEPNRGQVRAAEPVAWTARSPQAAFAFTADGALIRTKDQLVRLKMQGANLKAAYRPADAFAAPTSYFTAAYNGKIPGYQRLRRSSIYPGIDLVYYGKGTELEYDFEVAPGADPGRIQLAFESGDSPISPRLNTTGDLLIGGGAEEGKDSIVQHAPIAYQILANGKHRPVRSSYRVAADGTVSVALGKYDRSTRLVIDPTILYTQYFFGTVMSTTANAITHDAQGFVYVAGNTQAPDFFIQGNFAFLGNTGGQDAWVMKINPVAPDGNFVPFSTYYGGSLNEIVAGIAVDNSGIAYITGSTQSPNIPTTTGAYATALPGQTSTFIAAFDTTQATLTYGTYIGGALVDDVAGLALFNGRVYIAGTTTSTNFPTIAGAIETTPRGGKEVFFAEINPTASGTAALVAGTYLPGSADDTALAIAVDAAGMVYIAGETGSPDILLTSNAVQSVYNQGGDGFVTAFNPQTMQLIYGTYLGGSSYDQISNVIVEPGGHIGLVGYTLSPDLPATQNAFQTRLNGVAAAFLAIVDPSAKPGAVPVYCSYFGGSVGEVAYGAARDSKGLYYLTGYTLSPDMPTSPNALNPVSAFGGYDGFIARIDPTKGLNGLTYASYVTGVGSQLTSDVDVDANGIVYVVGWATANIFGPGSVGPGAIGDPNPGVVDGFILVFQP
jgi:hypothetical protein